MMIQAYYTVYSWSSVLIIQVFVYSRSHAVSRQAEGVYVVDRVPLKLWICERCFVLSGFMMMYGLRFSTR